MKEQVARLTWIFIHLTSWWLFLIIREKISMNELMLFFNLCEIFQFFQWSLRVRSIYFDGEPQSQKLKKVASTIIVTMFLYLNSQAPETTWALGAQCARSGTNGQAVVRSLQNFNERFRSCLKPHIYLGLTLFKPWKKFEIRFGFYWKNGLYGAWRHKKWVTSFIIQQQTSYFTWFSDTFVKL